jgi:hypothetical protein
MRAPILPGGAARGVCSVCRGQVLWVHPVWRSGPGRYHRMGMLALDDNPHAPAAAGQLDATRVATVIYDDARNQFVAVTPDQAAQAPQRWTVHPCTGRDPRRASWQAPAGRDVTEPRHPRSEP